MQRVTSDGAPRSIHPSVGCLRIREVNQIKRTQTKPRRPLITSIITSTSTRTRTRNRQAATYSSYSTVRQSNSVEGHIRAPQILKVCELYTMT